VVNTVIDMRFRKLRIAWSVFWGLAAVLLIVLWVRSLHTSDRVSGPLPGSGFVIMSRSGGLGIGIWRRDAGEGWTLHTSPSQKANLPYKNLGFAEFMVNADMYRVRWRYWCLILISVALATASWIRRIEWRFTTRTLLIALTLVAVVLGVVMWSVRR